MKTVRRDREQGGCTKILSREENRRRKGKWDATISIGKYKGGGQVSTIIYFTEFVERWTARDLYIKFKELGGY